MTCNEHDDCCTPARAPTPDACCAPPQLAPGDDRFRRALWVVLGFNAVMFVVEAIAGLAAGSMSLQADAVDFFGDSANYAITLAVLGMGARWRTGAAFAKGAAMTAFGLWVIGASAWKVAHGGVPGFVTMGAVGLIALAVNVGCAVILFRFRGGDANARSVWLCSRNDAISNLAVVVAASGVFATGTGWPDLAVAAVMAGLALYAGMLVLRHAAAEWHEAGTAVEVGAARD